MGRAVGRGILVSLLTLSGCAAAMDHAISRALGDFEALYATMRGVYQAVECGDEASYRQLVAITPEDAYSDALTATMFESIRLHEETERHTRSPTATRPLAALAAVDYRVNARAMQSVIDSWSFTICGDRATINELADRPGSPTLRRARDGRWMLVPTRWDVPGDTATYRLAVAEERALAKALSTARAAAASGSAKSIEDVNAILRSLLSEPTTKPRVYP